MKTIQRNAALSIKGGGGDDGFQLLLYSFTRSELEPHVSKGMEIELESLGSKLIQIRRPAYNQRFSKDARHFIERVVLDWGKGHRNWGRVKKGQAALSRKIHEIIPILTKESPAQLARQIDGCVSGLRLSYASKLLRMLFPQRFAVLDSMLEEALGIARNPSGYELLCSELARFIERHEPCIDGKLMRVADLELAIYRLNQQRREGKVRNASPQ